MEKKNLDREIFERSYELVTMYMGFRDKKSIKPAREILEQEIFGDNEQNYIYELVASRQGLRGEEIKKYFPRISQNHIQ